MYGKTECGGGGFPRRENLLRDTDCPQRGSKPVRTRTGATSRNRCFASSPYQHVRRLSNAGSRFFVQSRCPKCNCVPVLAERRIWENRVRVPRISVQIEPHLGYRLPTAGYLTGEDKFFLFGAEVKIGCSNTDTPAAALARKMASFKSASSTRKRPPNQPETKQEGEDFLEKEN